MMFRAEVQISVDGGAFSAIRAQDALNMMVQVLRTYGIIYDPEIDYPTTPDSPDMATFLVFEAKDFTHAQEILQETVNRGMQVFPGHKTTINALLLR